MLCVYFFFNLDRSEIKIEIEKKKKNESRRYEVCRLLVSRVSCYFKLFSIVSSMLVFFGKWPLHHSQIAYFDLSEINL